MEETLVNSEEVEYNEQSCRGKCFNAANIEIITAIYVEDDYVKKDAILWIQKNLRKYKFVGKDAKSLKKILLNASDEILYTNETDRMLRCFFDLLANNPFCVENGIGVVESSYIVGKSIDCYFIAYKNNFFIPIGCLEHFVHDKIELILAEYIENSKKFALEIVSETAAHVQNIEVNLQQTKKEKVATFPRFFMAGTTFLCGLLYVLYCLTKIDWTNLGYIFEHSASLYQILGFAAEKGFDIGHNCSLNHVLIVLAFIWLIYIAVTNVKIFNEYVNAKKYSKLKKVRKVLLDVKEKLFVVGAYVKQSEEFLKENISSFKCIFIKPHWSEKKYGPRIDYLNKNSDIIYNDDMNPVLPKTFMIFVCFILALGTTFIGYISRNDDFKVEYRDFIKNIQYESDVAKLRAESKLITIADGDIYTKDYAESLVLYHIGANTKCKLLDAESNDQFSKISFMTEYGWLNGWISKENISEYNPRHDDSVKKAIPVECTSSSELIGKRYYGAYNTVDGKFVTSWQEGADGVGYGEWISFQYGETKQIAALGIYNGNGGSEELYYQNVRPIDITLYFYNADLIVDTVSYTLQDGIRGMQYFALNKCVMADTIRLEIDSVCEGTKYQDACIAEIEVFYADIEDEMQSD